jgi:DDE superfamily endonuclease/Helix-turn-helix of DDE superfamily endonuclease
MLFSRMDIDHVLKNNRLVHALLGVSANEFNSLLPAFAQACRQEAESKKRERAVGGGRNGKIKSPRNKLFFILWYLKVYPTFDVAAYVFASSKTKTHIWVKNILPLLEKTLGWKLVLPKRRISTPEEFFAAFPIMKEVMLDGVERPTIRSKKKKTQGKHYSGKKKRHMRKNIVMTDSKKRVLFLSPTKHGRVHDKKLLDKSVLHIPEEISVLADTGFQGLQKQHGNTLIPAKKPRGGMSNAAQKAMNRLISSCRIPVEHAIGGMKRFRSVSEICRNKNGTDDRLMNVAAGLWNLKMQMA